MVPKSSHARGFLLIGLAAVLAWGLLMAGFDWMTAQQSVALGFRDGGSDVARPVVAFTIGTAMAVALALALIAGLVRGAWKVVPAALSSLLVVVAGLFVSEYLIGYLRFADPSYGGERTVPDPEVAIAYARWGGPLWLTVAGLAAVACMMASRRFVRGPA